MYVRLVRAALALAGFRNSGRCQCGHASDAHEHYRSGRECALCFLYVPAGDPALCMRYRPTWTWRRPR
jgi:hypothetical protein